MSKTVNSYAKINLSLKIIGRAQDGPKAGYHLLHSYFALIDLYDTIELDACTREIICTMHPAQQVMQENNIAYKAAHRLKQHLLQARGEEAKQLGVRMHITKNIPMGGGLGGGSSNAACILRELNKMWGAGLPLPELSSIGLELGSDVPFFLHESNAFVHGLGDIVTPQPRLNMEVMVIWPQIHVDTGKVYAEFAASPNENVMPKGERQPYGMKSDPTIVGHNDLYRPAVRLYPEIEKAMQAVQSLKGCNLLSMSGSGSSFFALFDMPEQLQEAKATLKLAYPQWLTYVCKI
jgi:4-diphosphocytidyl-2-C-methyl-D-erythritol kinase